jgi:hypothetical protein
MAYPHYLLPVLVEKPGDYLTRSGETVHVKEVVGRGIFTARVFGQYADETREEWRTSGRIFQDTLSPHDIVAPAQKPLKP